MGESNTVEAELRHLVASRPAGSQLPSVRELTRRHRASPVTVQRVIRRLELEGLVDARPGHGTFIAAQRAEVPSDVSWQTVALGARTLPGDGLSDLSLPSQPGVISFVGGYPDESLWPVGLLAAAAARAARRPGAWGRSPAAGIEPLRAWFAAEAGPGIRADDVVVVAGGQAALSAAFRSLAAPGDPLVIESPTYVGALEAARLAGLRPVPVPTDEAGVRPDLLRAALRATGATLVYLQPRLANPTGVDLGPARRAEVLDAVREAGAFLVEDDFARDFAAPERAAPPLVCDDRDGHVVHVRSLTKSTAPSLRIAGVVARGPAVSRLRNARLVDDFFVSTVLQETALGVVGAPGWSRHLVGMRRAIDERRELAIGALAHVDGCRVVGRPAGGLLLWLRLDDGLDDAVVARHARAVGLAVQPGGAWFPGEPDAAYLRLSVAGTPAADVADGVRRLERAIRAAQADRSGARR